MKSEPVAFINLIAGLVLLIIPVLIGFELVHWTPAQEGLATGFVSGAVVVLQTFFTRGQVVPTATANKQIAEAIKSPSSTTVEEVIAKVDAKN